MKKLFLTVALAAATLIGANAQLFVGGNLGLNFSTEDGDGTIVETEKSFGFNIAPKVGYSLNEKFSVGGIVSFGYDKNTTEYVDRDRGDTETATTSWGVTPFARYNFFTVGQFNIGAEAQLGIGGKSQKDEYSTFDFGLNIIPVVSWNISDKFALEAYFNAAGIGFNHSLKDFDAAGRDNVNTSSFGLGFDSSRIVSTIGAVYKF